MAFFLFIELEYSEKYSWICNVNRHDCMIEFKEFQTTFSVKRLKFILRLWDFWSNFRNEFLEILHAIN